MKQGDIIIVIPAYNPGEKLVELLREIYSAKFEMIILVNDGSERDYDGIFEYIKAEFGRKIILLKHAVNQGKGRALKTAINYILVKEEETIGIITVDADGQHKIQDIIKVKEALLAERDSIVMGCRSFGKDEKVNVPLRSIIGNVCTKVVLKYLCNINISDTQTGLRGIPVKFLSDIMRVNGERYEYEMNMLLNLVEAGVKLYEIPIETVYENNNASSHFNPLRDSLKIYATIGKYSLASIVSVVLDNLVFILGGAYTDNIWLLTFCGRAVASIVNFVFNKQLVFKRKGRWLASAFKYLCLVLISGTLSALCVKSISSVISCRIVGIKLFVEAILFFGNFYFQKNVVFRRS